MSGTLEKQSDCARLGWLGGRWLLRAILALSLGLAGAAALGLAVPPWEIGVVAAALLTIVSVGVAWPQSGVFARPVLGCTTSRPLVALTFDDGPHPVHTPQVLDLLDQFGQRATFFVIGSKAAQQPELLAEIVRRGHELGNHSWLHRPWTPALPARALIAELRQSSELLRGVSGHLPRWFRPPVGLVSPPVALAAQVAGLELVTWTATARDGVASADCTAGLARLTPALQPGAILVLHDGVAGRRGQPHAVVQILPQLLEMLQTRGLTSVTLSELLPP